MKINLTLPVLSSIFKHDAPLYKIIRLALPAFIAISSVTVFAGVRAHLVDYLNGYSGWITTPIYFGAYFLFSLAPDLLNAVLMAYLVRSLLNRYFSRTDIILNLFAVILCIFLSSYSYQMSQFSAQAGANAMAPEKEEIDLSDINSEYQKEKRGILADFRQEKADLEEQHKNATALLYQEYRNKLNPLRDQIQVLEKNRKASNTQWTDKEQKKLNSQIAGLEQELITKEAELLQAKNQKIEALTNRKNKSLDDLESNKQEDRKNIQSSKQENNDTATQLHNVFKTQFSKIAGFAIFIILILAALKEVIHFRNGVEPMPILGQLDFQFNWLQEILAYPFIAFNRKILNAVRRKYKALPPLEAPEEFPVLTDYQEQQIIQLHERKSVVAAQEKSHLPFLRRSNHNNKIGVPFIAHEGSHENTSEKVITPSPKSEVGTPKSTTRTTKSAHETETPRELKRRLNLYKKRYARHEQKRLAFERKGEKVPKRTLTAIKNNLKWVKYYEGLLK